MRTALFAIGAMICLVTPVWAGIGMKHDCWVGSDLANLHLSIKGEITQGDVEAVQRRLDAMTGKVRPKPSSDDVLALLVAPHDGWGCDAKRVDVGATLNSPGGSVDAAIRLGEIIRSAKGSVMVRAGDICYSSCVMVLAAAPRRHVESTARIGIHRPYFRTNLSLSEEDMDATYRKLTVKIENFLRLSGIRPQLASEMMRTRPEDVRILTRAELDDYGLGADNIAVQEVDAMREADRYGISRQELLRRRQKASRVCGPASTCQDRQANNDLCLRQAFCVDKVLGGR